MNSILNIILAVTLVLQLCHALPAVNKAIRNKIEEIRLQMPCGIDGGPSLVPFQKDSLAIEYEEDMIK